MGGFKENEGTMDLPDEKPAVFAMFVDWLYRSDLEVGRATTTEQFVGLFKLYFFAEKFCVNVLQNRLIDRIRLASGGSPRMGNCGPQITIAFAAFIFKNTPTGSELRNYCTHELAWRLWIYGTGTTMPDSNNILSMFSLWSDQNELIEKYFEFLRCNPTEIHGLWDDIEDGEVFECMFHRHGREEGRCYIEEEGVARTSLAKTIWDEKIDFAD